MRFHRWIQPVLVAIVAVSVLAPSAGCNKTPTSPSGVDVIAFGDSLTFGVGTTPGNNFVSVLSQRVGVSIVNSGWPGDTTGSALARLDTAVLSHDPDIVIVLLGGNDLLRGLPVQQRIDNITTIVERIRSDGAAVILVGLGDGSLDPFAGALPGLASRTSSSYVPGILEGIFGNPALMADAIHPNDAGHLLMANRLEPTLRAALAAISLQ